MRLTGEGVRQNLGDIDGAGHGSARKRHTERRQAMAGGRPGSEKGGHDLEVLSATAAA